MNQIVYEKLEFGFENWKMLISVKQAKFKPKFKLNY